MCSHFIGLVLLLLFFFQILFQCFVFCVFLFLFLMRCMLFGVFGFASFSLTKLHGECLSPFLFRFRMRFSFSAKLRFHQIHRFSIYYWAVPIRKYSCYQLVKHVKCMMLPFSFRLRPILSFIRMKWCCTNNLNQYRPFRIFTSDRLFRLFGMWSRNRQFFHALKSISQNF